MSVQFRLGRNDHKVVEDFLSRTPSATSAITLDPKTASRQINAAEAAREHDINVFFEPAVERLADHGFGLDSFPVWAGAPYVVDALATDPRSRDDLVSRTLGAHPDVASHVTAPHFFVDNDRAAALNVDLAENLRIRHDARPVRAVLTVSNKYAKTHAAALATEYVRAGITHLELRLSPFGGEDESLKKIRDGFAAAQAFTDAGLHITLGQSGNLGQVAVALGHVKSYSVGIGLLETVNHATTVNRQKKPPKPRTEDDPGGGPQNGVYLNGIAHTIPRKLAGLLLDHSDLRTRVGCRDGRCGTSVRGPLLDVRDHYLHSRDNQMHKLLQQPAGWRPTAEIDRLRAALGLRQHINTNYIGTEKLDVPPLKTRTLQSLISDIEAARVAS